MEENKEFDAIMNDPNLTVPEKLIHAVDFCKKLKSDKEEEEKLKVVKNAKV